MVCGGLTKNTWFLWGFIHVGIPEQSLKGFISPSFPGNTAGAVENRELGMDMWKFSFQMANK